MSDPVVIEVTRFGEIDVVEGDAIIINWPTLNEADYAEEAVRELLDSNLGGTYKFRYIARIAKHFLDDE